MGQTMKEKLSRLVFSTETGRICPECEQPADQCTCGKEAIPDGDGVVRVSLSTRGRKGAAVTLISGIPAVESELKRICKELKKKCGSGGSVKNHSIEIQGDKRDIVIKLLEKYPWPIKRSGG
ncbi:MAG: stress response translation initiation inhibitor YciH [Gammaproteobacteria bacterium]|nr:MAG: stress response translation initiation inhibitor YciH [Pseudomonadota bacterium]PIE38824.1 MAG: stress response translation initiation inhibitor YciH [Gammaproteobacteria bacterium]